MGPLTRLFAATALAMSAPATAAVQITDSNGILVGATGVDVGGTLYDVSFLDGTCSSVFSNCDDTSDFAIPAASGTLAAQSLLDQVFTGIFDTNPALTRGCDTPFGCVVLVPTEAIGGGSTGAFALNLAPEQDSVTGFGFPSSFDTTDDPIYLWARFTISTITPAVPESSTWAMMLMGFGAMGVSLRGRRRTKRRYQAA